MHADMMEIRPVRPARVFVTLCMAALLVPAAGAQSRGRKKDPVRRTRPVTGAPKPAPLPCGDLVGFQVLLDREGFSPGEIDGRIGDNLTHALTALQDARKIATTGTPDCDTWHALGGDHAGALVTSYAITEADANGPFTENFPRDLEEQAKLPVLGYRSIVEKLAERFHVAPALLAQMNEGAGFEAGREIRVPATQPFDPDAKPAHDPAADGLTIQVARDESVLRATRADGTLVFYAPVSSGSEHDPLPLGNWKVTSVDWHPVFHYNPDLFWDAKPDQNRATLEPGPNNPVGVVWIGVNIEHYGMHGTPEPGHVGHTESHGCVRLTNWDAAHLASLVAPGTPVIFK
jgi:lipoprotein-anchoring transpeptidase ErfK/SrfK